ncbi:hypothetical protein AURDEDRAFT_117163 [Auricularia subglabra TFB-10046 SS5]|nr:hypothetical protein AURDEDRAFT_117163 [Auricularia subglabra TFB-10046 SS5]
MPLTLLPESSCDICAEEYDTTNAALTPSVVPCGHVVCRRCWSALQPRVCPFCRAPFAWSDVRTLNCEIAPAAPSGALFGALSEFKDSLEALPEVDEPAPEPEPDPEPTPREREAAKAQRLLNKLHDAFQREREAGTREDPDMIGQKRILKTRRFLDQCEERRDYIVLERAMDMLEAFLDQRQQHKQALLEEEAHRITLIETFQQTYDINVEARVKARMEEIERQEAERKRAAMAPAYYSHYSPASRSTTPYVSPPAAMPLRSFHQIPASNDHNPMPAAPSIHDSLRRGPYGRLSSPDARSPRYASSPAPIAGPSRVASYSSYSHRVEVDSIPLLQPPPSAGHFAPQPPSEHPHPQPIPIPAPPASRCFSPSIEDGTPPASVRQFPPLRGEAGPPPRAPTARRRALPSEDELERHPSPVVSPSSPPPADDATGSGDPNFVFSLWRPGHGNVTPDVYVAPSSTRLADLPPPVPAPVSAYLDDARPQRRVGPRSVYKVERPADSGELVLHRQISSDVSPPRGNDGAAPPRLPMQHYRQRSREQVRSYYGHPVSQPQPDRRTTGLWSPMDSDSDAVRGL